MRQLFRLLIFLIQPYMFRATNSPILTSTFGQYVQLLVQCTRHCCRPVRCTKSCTYRQKMLLRMGEFVARNM